MGNRNIQSKILKMKKRHRYARFSGETSRFVERVGPVAFTEDEHGNVKTGETKMILVGKISLSRQVINTGRGPDPERMQEYYGRVSAKSYQSNVPPTIGMTEPMKECQELISRLRGSVPETNCLRLVDNHTGMLLLFWASNGKVWFFIDVDYRTKTFRRSCEYNKKETALSRLRNHRVGWVEVYSPSTK